MWPNRATNAMVRMLGRWAVLAQVRYTSRTSKPTYATTSSVAAAAMDAAFGTTAETPQCSTPGLL